MLYIYDISGQQTDKQKIKFKTLPRILLKGVNKPNPKKGPMFQDFLKYIVDRSPTKQNR